MFDVHDGSAELCSLQALRWSLSIRHAAGPRESYPKLPTYILGLRFHYCSYCTHGNTPDLHLGHRLLHTVIIQARHLPPTEKKPHG